MHPAHVERTSSKKKNRVRSAWISFIGRIVAQIVGAGATIVLGIAFLHKGSMPRTASAATQSSMLLPAGVQHISQADNRPSLLVLPLTFAAGDPHLESLADGITEAVTVDVTQLKTFRVGSRTTAVAYTAQHKPLSAIADELSVDFVIEGSVVATDDQVRVTARLIDARRDEHVWARIYEHTTGDVLGLQRDISGAIAREVEGTVAAGEKTTGSTGD